MTKTIIIAEVGECWNGEDWRADRLIGVAASAGCDFVKFQMLDREGVGDEDPERDWFLKLALGESQLQRLKAVANRQGIDLLVTPERAFQVPVLLRLGCESVKVASSCITDDEMLREIDGNFRRVFMSTGLADLDEVDHAVSLLSRVEELFLMHCVAEYPTGVLLEERGPRPLDDGDARLAMMSILADRYPHALAGYSDHTVGLCAPVVAVAAGARVIEKHVTLDRETPMRNLARGGPYLGTDHALSVEPSELEQMVRRIRQVERIFGERKWERSEGELKLRSFLRQRFRQNR